MRNFKRAVPGLVAAVVTVVVAAGSPLSAGATTWVTQCSAANWPDGQACPFNSYPPRHTFTTGRGASAGIQTGHMYVDWYVAYLNSNGSLPKYSFGDRVGNTLWSPMGGNSEYLRGYIYTLAAGTANLYNEGGY
jgi:hypothetical protein